MCMKRTLGAACALVWLAGCPGKQITLVRLVAAPAKPESCELQFLQLPASQLEPASDHEYELLGHIVLGDTGKQDPLDEKNRNAVRPHACQMGGEAVTVLQQATNSAGSSIDYGVVRKRGTPPAAPSKF